MGYLLEALDVLARAALALDLLGPGLHLRARGLQLGLRRGGAGGAGGASKAG